MATQEVKVELGVEASLLESKEKLTSVTNHENFSVPEGHEVTVVQHTTNNAEAVVSVSSEDVNVAPSGRLAAIAKVGDAAEEKLPNDEGAQAEGLVATAKVQDAVEAVQVVETPSNHTVPQKAPEKMEDAIANPTNCLVDKTTVMIKADENEVVVETATQDQAIVPGEPVVTPTVFRPRRPPPPSQAPPQIAPIKSNAVESAPGAASTSDPNIKSGSMTMFRAFRSKMRQSFKKVKGKLPSRHKDGGGKKRNTIGADGSGHDGISFQSSTDLYASHPSSVTNTPQITRKEERIALAMPDFRKAMEDEPRSQDEVLNWTAQSIAVEASQRRAETGEPVPVEGEVRSMHVARGSPQRGLLAQMTPGSPSVSPPVAGDSRRQPASPSRPVTDYSHEPSTRRPGTFWSGLSLDRRRNGQVRRHVPLEIRRTQTLRTTDYPARLGDRIRRYHTEYHGEESEQPDGSKRKTLRTTVTERSDRISWPFKTFSLRRNRPPKKVYATGQDPNSSHSKLRPTTSSPVNSGIVPKIEGTVHVEPPVLVNKEIPQRITPPCLSREVTSSNPVLTSLASHKRMMMLQQMSKGIHVEVRPVAHLVIHSDEPVGQAAPLPYFSDTLASSANWTQNEASLALRNSVEEVHPFLAAWTSESASGEAAAAEAKGEADEATKDEVDVTCLQYYLTNCLKLYSADLQGEFAAFHYPLNDSHVRRWPQCVILDDCAEVRMLREPQMDTEYLELVNLTEANIGQRVLFYASQPIDRLLTAWLDSQSTVRATVGIARRENPAYHPVQVVARLSQLLTLEGEHNALLDACIRLAVLLAYNYVKTQCQSMHHEEVLLNTDAKHITLFMTTTNCLVAFTRMQEDSKSDSLKVPVAVELHETVAVEEKPIAEKSDAPTACTEQSEEKTEAAEAPESPVPGTSAAPEPQQPTEPTVSLELATLLKSTNCEKCTTSEQAIDSVISEIHKQVTGLPAVSALAVTLMRAVVPPDWMAMMLARVGIAKCSPTSTTSPR